MVGSFCWDYALHPDPAVERGLEIPRWTSLIRIINSKHIHYISITLEILDRQDKDQLKHFVGFIVPHTKVHVLAVTTRVRGCVCVHMYIRNLYRHGIIANQIYLKFSDTPRVP